LFSLSDLRGVRRYEATNDASVIDRLHTQEETGYILPAACEPLFEATVLNRFPNQALDGVGTFWELNRSAVSLFTYRFADVAKADREYRRLATVLDNCRDVPVEVHARPASRGMLTATPVLPDTPVPVMVVSLRTVAFMAVPPLLSITMPNTVRAMTLRAGRGSLFAFVGPCA
jgi:hypothetical protein